MSGMFGGSSSFANYLNFKTNGKQQSAYYASRKFCLSYNIGIYSCSA